MSSEKDRPYDDLTSARRLPKADEVSRAAYDSDLTLKLVQEYRLTAVDLAQLIERLQTRPVPW